MSRQHDAEHEAKQARRWQKVGRLADYGLSEALGRAGATLLGFSAKMDDGDCLLTLRVEMAGRRQIAFVGSETLGGAMIKASKEAGQDALTFKDDKWA